MVKGIDAALHAVEGLTGAGPGWILRSAGRSWAASAGGTSGVLWGAGLEAAGESLTDTRGIYDASAMVDGVTAFENAIVHLGGAEPGDKTLVDALIPFGQTLKQELASGRAPQDAWRSAAFAAADAAVATAALRPKKGRARPLADRSVGTPDAGATSFALIVHALGAFAPASGRAGAR
jgi:dihydroxyacetone kinase